MDKHSRNAMPIYRSEISVDALKFDFLKKMILEGQIIGDHFRKETNRAILILTPAEIDILRGHGFVVKTGENMLEHAERAKTEIIESRPLQDNEGVVSGHVTRYLDAKEIIDKFQTLHKDYQEITHIIDLPYKTSGYDGNETGLRGPATVKAFRINSNLQSPKPGILIISGTHAREWVPPLASVEFAEQLVKYVLQRLFAFIIATSE